MKNIPKILHLYWDESPMSKLQVFTVESFQRLNPDWSVNIYVPKEKYKGNASYIPEYKGINHFHKLTILKTVNIIPINLKNCGVKLDIHNILRSDILRYYLLYEFGGVWSDFDVIWLKPMEQINQIDTYGKVSVVEMGAMVTFFNKTCGHHNIGILLSSKEHPFYKTLIDKTIKIQENHTGDDKALGHQEFGSTMWSTLYPTLDDVTNRFEDVIGFPYEAFAPYSIFDIEKLYLKNDTSLINNKNVIGLHWFNGHPLSKEYINENKFGNNSSMTSILQQCGFENG